MSDLDHARTLLKTAEGDLKALRGMALPTMPGFEEFFTDEIFGFHAQQSAEKCLKAWIAVLGKRYPRSHDLQALIDTLDEAKQDTSELLGLVDLNSFAVQYRYESLSEADEHLDRPTLLREIEVLYARVEAKISPPT